MFESKSVWMVFKKDLVIRFGSTRRIVESVLKGFPDHQIKNVLWGRLEPFDAGKLTPPEDANTGGFEIHKGKECIASIHIFSLGKPLIRIMEGNKKLLEALKAQSRKTKTFKPKVLELPEKQFYEEGSIEKYITDPSEYYE